MAVGAFAEAAQRVGGGALHGLAPNLWARADSFVLWNAATAVLSGCVHGVPEAFLLRRDLRRPARWAVASFVGVLLAPWLMLLVVIVAALAYERLSPAPDPETAVGWYAAGGAALLAVLGNTLPRAAQALVLRGRVRRAWRWPLAALVVSAVWYAALVVDQGWGQHVAERVAAVRTPGYGPVAADRASVARSALEGALYAALTGAVLVGLLRRQQPGARQPPTAPQDRSGSAPVP